MADFNKVVKLLGLKTITGKELESLCKMKSKLRKPMLKDLAKKEKAFQNLEDLEKALDKFFK
ncbi:MAG: hypothetical protein ACKVHR_07770 [Pirellulales bacterium]|jgi:hypothetical protein